MDRSIRWSMRLGVAALAVVVFAGTALASVSFGSQSSAVAGNYSWNYSNSMDYTGSGGTFKLHDAWGSDAAAPSQSVFYTNSADGTTWSSAKKMSGSAIAERPTLAAAGSTVIIGWATQTSYTSYDASKPRVFQVKTSTNAGSTFGSTFKLSPGTGRVDYPIVAAAATGFSTTNVYGIWTDANTGNIRFRESTDGGVTWSAAITLGTTTADAGGNATTDEGKYGYPSIAATGNLIAATWISDNAGTVQVRGAKLTSASSAGVLGGWDSVQTLTGAMPLITNGYAIASASAGDTSRVTVAWNTATAVKVATYNASGWVSLAGTTVYTFAAPYTAAYGIAAEPAPGGGMVVAWAACKDTTLSNDCKYTSKTARIDMVTSTSANSTTFSAPAVLSSSSTAGQPINDAPSVVYEGGKTYVQYNGWTASYTKYRLFIKTGTGSL